MKLHRGEIWLTDLDPVRPGELGKSRPCLVISDVHFNDQSPAPLVMPITSYAPTIRSPEILATKATGLTKDSSVLALHVRAVAKSRFIHRIGRAPSAVVEQAAELLVFVVGRGQYLHR